MEVYKAVVPDGIYPKFIREYLRILAIPLKILFNKSLETGELPADWNNSIVTPIFKKYIISKRNNTNQKENWTRSPFL